MQEPRRLNTEERTALLEQVLRHEVALGARIETRAGVIATVSAHGRQVTLAIDEQGRVLVDGKPAQPAPRAHEGQPLPGTSTLSVPLNRIGVEERKVLLARVLQHEVSLGASVDERSEFAARLVVGQRRVVLSIDECGQVLVDGQVARPGPPGSSAPPRAEAPSAASSPPPRSGTTGFVARNLLVATVFGVVFVAVAVALLVQVVSHLSAPGRVATQRAEISDIDAVSFLPMRAGQLGRGRVRKAPGGNTAWATYSASAHPDMEVEVQAQWQGQEFDALISAGGTPDEMAGRRVYLSGPNVYDQFKIRWTDRGWHYYVRVSYRDAALRSEAEGVARSVAVDVIANGSRLTSAAR